MSKECAKPDIVDIDKPGSLMVKTDIIINDIEYEFTIKSKNMLKFKQGIIFISISIVPN
jgi:hypothetical protein